MLGIGRGVSVFQNLLDIRVGEKVKNSVKISQVGDLRKVVKMLETEIILTFLNMKGH